MSMWFWMKKVVRIRTNQRILLVWILNFCCLDHDDVTWDGSKGDNFGKQGGERRWWDKEFYKRVGRVGGTWSREPHTLFWYSTYFKCFFEFYSTKHEIML
jgi:hypothetical protein